MAIPRPMPPLPPVTIATRSGQTDLLLELLFLRVLNAMNFSASGVNRFHGNHVKTLPGRQERSCTVNKSALGCEA
jgi:hypothetical protein